ENSFVQNGGVLPVGAPPPHDYLSNAYVILQGDTSLKINVDSKTRKVVRKDFFGLFGSLEDTLKHEITTSGNTFADPTSNASEISIIMKKYYMDQTEIP
ncbi:hypothetical protein BGZ65_012852, partial [Modicella reniformis]